MNPTRPAQASFRAAVESARRHAAPSSSATAASSIGSCAAGPSTGRSRPRPRALPRRRSSSATAVSSSVSSGAGPLDRSIAVTSTSAAGLRLDEGAAALDPDGRTAPPASC
ncbi:hypothetical protein C2845_PM01G45890 [Panicum miliaceum]|uniref:Uncharacterized protein n=1 Tax=Panicum miliaceum TaxID=4540 RepID=A0A3L6TGS6_PANMI|nr:hypothetical protein C2845_PM01G45890 [Panicum miliaceum]